MKLKNLLPILGLRGKPKHYGYTVKSFTLTGYGQIYYAQWQHPGESEKLITEAEIQEYRKFIREGDFCIDIGAHTGDSTIPMAIAAGKSGFVMALEPNPYVYPVLEKNARLNRGSINIYPVLAAAMANEGTVTFEYSDSGFCNGGRHEGISRFRHGHAFKLDVQGMNLARELRDSFYDLLPRLKFIKVDVEGYDLYVLKSLADIVAEFKPYIKAEVFKWTSAEYRRELYDFFASKGYAVYKTNSNSDLLGERIYRDDMVKWKQFDIFCVPENRQ